MLVCEGQVKKFGDLVPKSCSVFLDRTSDRHMSHKGF